MEALLASETDLAGFRHESQVLLAHQVPPESVVWHTARAENSDLFADPVSAADSRPQGVPKAASAIVPASFLRLCEVVVLHHDPERFALLYRLLWRLVHEPGLRHDPVDADMSHAHQMAQSVRRDIHKMKATLRLLPAPDGSGLQLAWYEPTHHILQTVAAWFAKRSPEVRFAIFSPERSVEWDGERLHWAPGVARTAAPSYDGPPDAWLARYRAVFDKDRARVAV
ncbi:TIGR03915 family putative DNA repair protein [Caenimonas aquaedulcis]|uniref:TIGR03915 family putative DNA repair protein n=1 Tax=Caenimonas aquaedulcis TaxID=2793270 RepID=A0A931H5Y9_9BURK|nr:TIGR03915 family putative DNA repair protein [Caenimonas aquaedulcis]MBG9389025.1 TIGR03915 family putative DNA repair protein [Caenimonas aquaedulcis]